MADPATVARLGTPLTAGELRVIAMMRTADSELDAARQLHLSPHTVRNHLANARSRLGVRTTRQLVLATLA